MLGALELKEELGTPPSGLVKLLTSRFLYLYAYLNLRQTDIEMVAQNMFVQAFLCPDSQIVDLRMAIYFDACKVKRGKWLAVIGSVTFEAAFKGDESVFTQMVGAHTHGHNKQQFWALLKASLNNEHKSKTFLERSNQTAGRCVEKVKWGVS